MHHHTILKGNDYARRNPIFWNWRNGKALRHGNHRLVSDRDEPWELYDVRVDLTETNNLAERHPEIGTELNALYESWAKA